MTQEHPRPWRQGHKIKRNIYDANDQPILMAPDAETAAQIVEGVNAAQPTASRAVAAVNAQGETEDAWYWRRVVGRLERAFIVQSGANGWHGSKSAALVAFDAMLLQARERALPKTPGPVGGSADAAHGDTAGEAPSGSSDANSAQPPTGTPATPAAKKHCFECGSPEHGASACPKVPGNLREHYRRTRGAIEFLEDATETPEPVCPTCGKLADDVRGDPVCTDQFHLAPFDDEDARLAGEPGSPADRRGNHGRSYGPLRGLLMSALEDGKELFRKANRAGSGEGTGRDEA